MTDSSSVTTGSPVDSRLVPPRPTRGVVPRDALLARLTEARRRRCIVVQGPAGYGKTTMLVAWMRALGGFGYEVAWLSLSETDNDVATWLAGLAGSVARVDPEIALEAEQLGQAATAGSDAIERTIIALVRGIARHGRELVLVLDDLHHLSDPRTHSALKWLVDYAPPNLHLVFASRSPVPVPLDRLRAEGELLELGMAELQFTAAESQQFLQSQLGELDAASAARLHVLTDGWAAGLQLFALAWKKRRRAAPKGDVAEAFFQKALRNARAFSTYFEREVLDHLPPALIALLVRVSPCSRFCASLCAALLGDVKMADAAALLARLERDNLFLTQVGPSHDETWYRLHPLLNDTLAERFAALDEATRRAVHVAAWQWFRDRGLLDEAIQHALDAGEPAAAAELVEACAPQLFLRGERNRLMVLVRQLPPAKVRASLQLRMWMARVQLYRREFDDCAATLDAVDAAMPAGDARNRFTLATLRGALAAQRDDIDGAQAMVPRLEAPPASADPIIVAGSRQVLSWLYIRQGRYALARATQTDAPGATIDGMPLVGSVVGVLFGKCMIGLSHALEGQMSQAEQIYRATLRDALQGGRSCVDTANFAASLLGEVLYEYGEMQQVRELLEPRVEVLEYVSLPDSVLRLLTVLAGARWSAGHRLEALAYLERLEDYAIRLGLDRLLASSLSQQAVYRMAGGEFSAAQELLARLATIDARHAHDDASPFSEIHFAAEWAAIRSRLDTGDVDQAGKDITSLLAYCRSHGKQREAAGLLVMHAGVEARRDRMAAAHADMIAALELGHRLGLVRTIIDHDLAVDLVAQVAALPTLDPVLAFYAERLLRSGKDIAAQAGKPRQAGRAMAPKFSQRETDVVWLLGQSFNAKKIARALGLSPETVKWHLGNIYSKLGVSGRDEAIDRIRDLGDQPRSQL